MASYIKGNFSREIYQSNTGYYVGIMKVSDTNDEKLSEYIGRSITFTGYFHELNQMDTYLFYGKMILHEKYGEQFQVESYERCRPEEKDSIVEFLTSGLFKGIGEKKAKAIVDVLGKDTLKIILETPDNLILIPGISKANADMLHEKLKEYEASYEIILYLTEMGFSTKDAMLIYHSYQKKTREIVDENIYQLIQKIHDLTFKKIDMIALRNGILKDQDIRIEAAILYLMEEVSNTYGHSYYLLEEIEQLLPRILGLFLEEDIVLKHLKSLEVEGSIVHKEEKYYLKEMYEAECLIVKRFRRLNRNEERKSKKLDDMIQELENFFEIQYNDCQLEAVKKSYLRDFLIITGGPGTGKTTIMKGIIELYRMMEKLSYEKLSEKVALLAPTGRAAKRMTETTFMRASTIHRFLKWQKDTDRFQVNEYNKSKVEFVIIDEASMIDTYLMANLLKGLSANCKIVLVGDDRQLPSVGPGQVLHDLIHSKKLEVVELTELYRQGKNSNIVKFAYDIRERKLDSSIFNIKDDLTFIECPDSKVLSNVCEICTTYKDYDYKKFQILAPMYKGLNGIDVINKEVQVIFNQKDSSKMEHKVGEFILRENDKVIQLTNMPDDNVYNGDIGLIERIQNSPKKEIHIDFDGNLVKYTPANYIHFRLAYAISIHKSQGSEFDVVVIPIVKGYHKMLYQKLIYTAVTRAKKKLYLIGDLEALRMAIMNDFDDLRRTSIEEYLIHGIS